jgi:hypothetical protein
MVKKLGKTRPPEDFTTALMVWKFGWFPGWIESYPDQARLMRIFRLASAIETAANG